MADPRTRNIVLAAAIFAAAAAYFLLTYNRTVNPTDEGLLLYNFQKTATGQVPHRDFYDAYGPAVYWLGGGLFRLFGSKVMVIRIFLLILKTAMVVLVFSISRRMMPIPFAIGAALLFTLSWGDPLHSVMNILYAGHLNHLLMLLVVLLVMLYVDSDKKLWLLLASMCIGLSMTFKFHAGVIGFMGVAIFLSLKERAPQLDSDDPDATVTRPAGIVDHILRAGKCLGAAGVMIFYLILFSKYRLDPYYFFIFLLPLFLLLGHILIMDMMAFGADGRRSSSGLRRCYLEILIVALPSIVFFAIEVIYFSIVGGLDEFIYDTFTLPLVLDYYRPMTDYRLHALAIAAIVILILAAIQITDWLRKARPTVLINLWRVFMGVALVVVFASPILKKTAYETWHMRTVNMLPTTVLLLGVYLFIKQWRAEKSGAGITRDTLSLALVMVFASQAFIISFPRSDEAHIQMNGTVIFVLVSLMLRKLYAEWGSSPDMRVKIRGAILSAACAAMLATPFIWSMTKLYIFSPVLPERLKKKLPAPILSKLEAGSLESYPELELDFPRSRGLKVTLWPVRPHNTFVLRHKKQVIEFIRENTEEGEKIFVMASAQMIYFLSERDNFIQKENYFLYLAAVKLIDNADRVRLTDEQFTRRLIEERPRLVIRVLEQFGDQSRRIADIWPGAAEYIEENYERVAVFGVYEILQPIGPGEDSKKPAPARGIDSTERVNAGA